MPDIDVDFEDGRREEVIAYVGRKYGQDHVAQIITFGTMLARAAIRDVGRVLGHSYGEVDRIAKAVPNQLGIRLDEAIQIVARAARAWSRATRRSSGSSTSPATSRASPATPRPTPPGVVISREPLTELMPLQKATNSDGLMTQYEMHAIEALGLLKFDFLGLSNLTILRQAVDLVRANRGIEIDLDRDPARRRQDVRAAGLGRDDRRLPAGVGGHAPLRPRPAPDVGLRPRRDGRALPARARWTTSRPTSGASTARSR